MIVAFNLQHSFEVPFRKQSELAPKGWGAKTQESFSLTLKQLVMGPFSLKLMCDISGLLLLVLRKEMHKCGSFSCFSLPFLLFRYDKDNVFANFTMSFCSGKPEVIFVSLSGVLGFLY